MTNNVMPFRYYVLAKNIRDDENYRLVAFFLADEDAELFVKTASVVNSDWEYKVGDKYNEKF
jgi:hypothetical protein